MPLGKMEFYEALAKPLKDVGGWSYNEAQIGFMYAKLDRESLETLEKASLRLVEEKTRKPTVSEILDTVKISQPYVPPVSTITERIDYTPTADSWLATTLGQRALREGWGYMAWDIIQETGKDVFTDAEVIQMQNSHVQFCRDIGDLESGLPNSKYSIPDPRLRAAALELLKVPMANNDRLKRKYLRAA